MSIVAVIADLHIGRRKKGLKLDCAHRILQSCHDHGAEHLVICGDIIDRRAEDSYRAEVYELLHSATKQFESTHFIAGNHDVHHELTFPEQVTVHPALPHYFELGDIRAWTCAVEADPDPRVIDYPRRQPDDKDPLLGIVHTSLHGAYSKKVCLPVATDELVSSGFDAWILGHVHTPITEHTNPFVGWVGQGCAVLFNSHDSSLTRFDPLAG